MTGSQSFAGSTRSRAGSLAQKSLLKTKVIYFDQILEGRSQKSKQSGESNEH
jgi:hypothetical protein